MRLLNSGWPCPPPRFAPSVAPAPVRGAIKIMPTQIWRHRIHFRYHPTVAPWQSTRRARNRATKRTTNYTQQRADSSFSNKTWTPLMAQCKRHSDCQIGLYDRSILPFQPLAPSRRSRLFEDRFNSRLDLAARGVDFSRRRVLAAPLGKAPDARAISRLPVGFGFGQTRTWLGLVDLSQAPVASRFFREVHPGSEMVS